MDFLFGKSPDQQSTAPVVWGSVSPNLIEEVDITLEDRIKKIVSIIWWSIKLENERGKIVAQAHNSIIDTTISKIQYDGTNGNACLITFNDRPWDDDFEVEWDMDHNPDSVNDVYAVKIHQSGSFIVERGHPDEFGVLHFHPIEHEEKIRVITFIEWCMNSNSLVS